MLRGLRTRLLSVAGRSDVARWNRDETYQAAWSERHALMARGIRPSETVIDLGSGPRAFEQHLPTGCRYIPVDLVGRGPGSVVFDFNSRHPWPSLTGDVAVMSGVVEYIHDVGRFLAAVAEVAPRGVVSYSVADSMPVVSERRAHGWVNGYTEAEFVDLLDGAGWTVTETGDWWIQRLFWITRSGSD